MLRTCRRRPFLIRSCENTLIKLLLSLEFFDEEGRKKLAIGKCGSLPVVHLASA